MAVVASRRRRVDPDPSFFALHRAIAPQLWGGAEWAALRARALERFRALGIPTRRDESWKFTDVVRIVNRPMRPAEPRPLPFAEVRPYLLGGSEAVRLVFLDGRLVPEWSRTEGLPAGAIVESLADTARTRPEALARALEALDDGRAFTALNAAFLDGGAWIEIPEGVALAAPLQLLFLSAAREEAVMAHPRCILRVGRNAALTLLETHAGLGEGAVLANVVLQLALGEGARLDHDRIARAPRGHALLVKLDGSLGAGARYRQTTVVVGGALVRNEHELRIEGPEAECLLSGVAMPRAGEQVDTLVRLHHCAGGSHSDQHFKSIVEDRGHHAFAGKIIVHRGALKTNAYQKNDNLLLGADAEVDTKPELEIYADDVKCSHGATCGELDASALFYLRARGLDPETARALLVYAFAEEVIARLTEPSARAFAERMLLERLGSDFVSPESELLAEAR
ncbi:MAG: Fe-S cluster assembly protein SufD [Geminicoccaceae bacterium]|nr:Fe-S cluster assembly protein SufD [Geminicoccaceae bacterium]